MTTAIGVISVAAALLLSACSATATNSTSKATLRIGDPASTISFNPLKGDNISNPLIYDYLMTQDAKGYHPRAAQSFAYNKDNTVLTIKLRSGLTFSDGSPITAKGVKDVILWQKDNGAFFSAITGVDVVDKLTLRVNQSHADRNVMLSLWTMPLITEATIKNPDKFAASPVESGPYLYDAKNSISGSTYEFVRNPKYWNAQAFSYDKVEVKLLSDVTSRLNALKSGQIDAAPLTSTTATDAKGSGLSITQFYANDGGMLLGDRNGVLGTPIADLRVRQAINMAFDRDSMVKSIYNGFATASSQPFAEGAPGYQKDEKDKYAYNPAKAKALLADAGYPNGFAVQIPSYTSLTGDVEAYVKQALGDIGISVTWVSQSDDSWIAAFSGGKYPIVPIPLPFTQSPDTADPSFFWNPWKNTDPAAIALLKQINEGNHAEQVAATDKLGKILLDQAWTVTWAHPATIWASTNAVKLNQPEYSDWVRIGDFAPAK